MTTNKTKSIAILNNKPPFANAIAKEAMDVALIFGTYEQDTHLFFQGDGVYQLISGQNPSGIEIKDFLKTFSAFEFYDLNHIYVCEQSLIERKLTASFHIDNVKVLDKKAFSLALHQHQIIFNF